MKIKEVLKSQRKLVSICLAVPALLAVIIFVAVRIIYSKGYRGNKNDYSEEVSKLIYDIGCHAISGKSYINQSYEYPFSKALKNSLSHYHIVNGNFTILLDIYFPENAGLAEGLGFYIPSEDKAYWVAETIVRAEEERIALELKKMEESLEDVQEPAEDELNEETSEDNQEKNQTADKTDAQSDSQTDGSSEEEKPQITQTAEEIEAELDKEFDGKIITDKKSKLVIIDDNGDILMPMETSEGSRLVQANGKTVIRRFYNDKLRITKKEKWIIDSVNTEKPESVEEYKYEADGETLASKIINSGNDFTVINYTSKQLLANMEKYLVIKNKKYTKEKRNCSYNDEGKILSDEKIDYVYTDDTYKKLNYTFSKKYLYEYNEGDIPPDFKYYENGVMKMHNKYAAEKGNYTSQIFFDDDLSVKTYYENNVHVRDVYYRGKNIIREKVYENEKSE